MQVYAIKQNEITFKDDNTYIPPSYSYVDAMHDLKQQGYVIQGKDTAGIKRP